MSCKISVIIPVYNAETYIEESVASIISSSVFNEIEVLLIDDGSKDGSGFICDRFSQKYENIRTFHIENGGVSNARNIALDRAKGEYITFCDADDYYLNDILKTALQKLSETEADLLFYEYLNENANSSQTRITYPFEKDIVLSDNCNSELFRFMLGESRFNSLWNKVFRREVVEENGIRFNKEQRRGEDRDFVIRFLNKCKSAYYLPKVGYFYRYVKTSIINRPQTDYYDNIYLAYKFKVEMAEEFNVISDELKDILEPAIVKQIVSCAFSSAEYDFSSFAVTLNKLFANDELMEIVRRNNKIKFRSPIHKAVRGAILTKKTRLCWAMIKVVTAVNKLVRKVKR